MATQVPSQGFRVFGQRRSEGVACPLPVYVRLGPERDIAYINRLGIPTGPLKGGGNTQE